MTVMNSLRDVSDADLLARVNDAVSRERAATVELIAALMELDRRELYLAQGCSSLYTYCTQVLHLGENAAHLRIKAARAALKFPLILERLQSGALNLTSAALLKPHLTEGNHVAVIDAASRKTKYEVQKLVATLDPGPGASDECRIQLTISLDTYGKLRRVQDLLRHRVPNGDVSTIFDKAITLLLHETLKTTAAATRRPRSTALTVTKSRRIPAPVRRAVWNRDGGRCAFVGTLGRCQETAFLQYHHVVTVADGGETSVKNVELRCRAHNVYEAQLRFGRAPIDALRRRRKQAKVTTSRPPARAAPRAKRGRSR
jgi:hypothetical protein